MGLGRCYVLKDAAARGSRDPHAVTMRLATEPAPRRQSLLRHCAKWTASGRGLPSLWPCFAHSQTVGSNPTRLPRNRTTAILVLSRGGRPGGGQVRRIQQGLATRAGGHPIELKMTSSQNLVDVFMVPSPQCPVPPKIRDGSPRGVGPAAGGTSADRRTSGITILMAWPAALRIVCRTACRRAATLG